MNKSKQINWQKRLQYHFDNFMSKGGLSLFLALLAGFLAAFVIMTIIRYIAKLFFPDKNISTFFGLIVGVINQLTGLSGLEDNPSVIDLIVGLVTIFLGLVLFSSLVAFITQQFEAKIESLKQGKSDVIEENHTLILGFDEKLVDIIEELSIANLSEKKATVVILSEQEKPVLDDLLRNYFKNLKVKNTRIVTRSGSISSMNNLQKVGLKYARSVIILNASKDTDSEQLKWQGDAQVIKALLAIASITDEANRPPIVAEIHLKNNCELAQRIDANKITIIKETDILARIQVQASRSIGIAGVYLNLIGFEGSEFYFYSPTSGWNNLTFGQLPFYLSKSLPLGIQYRDGTIKLNPNKDYILQGGDKVLLISEDDSLVSLSPTPIYAVDTSKSIQIPQISHQNIIEKYLLIGWNAKTKISLQEYGKYLDKGSSVVVALLNLNDEIIEKFNKIPPSYPDVDMQIIGIENYDYETLENLNPPQFKTVSIFADRESDSAETDTQVLTILLTFKQILQNHAQKTGEIPATELIAECVNSENSDLIVSLGIQDFILSNKIIAKISAQISQEPRLMAVYNELFSEEGNEIYLKSIDQYFNNDELNNVSFADCILRAQAKKEVCIGIKINSKVTGAVHSFADNIYINPDLGQRFQLTNKDFLIVLSGDE
jgi:hypothetical protein